MKALNNILLCLGDDSDEASLVLEKAAALARGSNTTVHAVRVVHEGIADLGPEVIDRAAELKSFILEAEETFTEELLEGWRARLPDLEAATLWNARPWEGFLHAAERTNSDLIVKAASRHPRFGEFVRTPDDWNLLRHSPVPVMLVKPLAWQKSPVVLCALNVLDDAHEALNATLLEQAAALATVLDGELHVVTSFPLFEPWVGEFGGLRDYDGLKRDVEADIKQRVHKLVDAAGVNFDALYAEEGRADEVIGRLAHALEAEIVVVGTHARQGVSAFVLGNTSERLVHHLDTDIMAVHAPRGS